MEMLGFMILIVAESSGLASWTSADSHSYDSLTWKYCTHYYETLLDIVIVIGR